MFLPDGKVRLCLLNAPTSTFHNSVMSGYGIYEGLEKVNDKYGAKFVVDFVFKFGNKQFVIISSQGF